MNAPATPSFSRLRTTLRGAVQGVGFRPHVYRLACEMGLHGWVCNTASGVVVEAEGTVEVLDEFLDRIDSERPPRSFLQSVESAFLDPVGLCLFRDPRKPNRTEDRAGHARYCDLPGLPA